MVCVCLRAARGDVGTVISNKNVGEVLERTDSDFGADGRLLEADGKGREKMRSLLNTNFLRFLSFPCAEPKDLLHIDSGLFEPTGKIDEVDISRLETHPSVRSIELRALADGRFFCLVVEDLFGSRIVESPEVMLALFGTVDSREKAVLLAAAHGYVVGGGSVYVGGIREIEDGFEIIAVESLRLCAKAFRDRVLVHISADGVVRVLGREIIPNAFFD